MNFKLKTLVAAAVTTMTMSGAANAININEMFLVASDDSGAKTFIAALGNLTGSAKDFVGTSNLSTNLSGADWTNFLSGAQNVKYQVLGFSPAVLNSGSFNAADELVLSSNGIVTNIRNSSFNTVNADAGTTGSTINQFLQNFHVGLTGSGTKYVVGGGADSIGAVKNNVFSLLAVDTQADLGANLNFWNVSRSAATNSVGQTAITRFVGEGAENATTPDFWNLSSAGVLTYNTVGAPIPEADTWAMMLLGLGFMGFVARRRQA